MKNNFYLYKVHAIDSDDPTKTFQECGIVNAPTYNEAVINLTEWYGDNDIFEFTIENLDTGPILFPEKFYKAIQQNNFNNFC